MIDKDLQNIFDDLRHDTQNPRLSKHERSLRNSLLAYYDRPQTVIDRFMSSFRSPTIKLGANTYTKNIKRSTMAWVTPVVLVTLLGAIVLFRPAEPATAKQLVEAAGRQVQVMNPEELQRINAQYKQDINQCLAEAKTSKSLRILTVDELKTFPGELADKTKTTPDVKNYNYLTFTENNGHRIVIALNTQNEPVDVVDVDASSNLPAGAQQPNIQ